VKTNVRAHLMPLQLRVFGKMPSAASALPTGFNIASGCGFEPIR
jgi:hypothetical protein